MTLLLECWFGIVHSTFITRDNDPFEGIGIIFNHFQPFPAHGHSTAQLHRDQKVWDPGGTDASHFQTFSKNVMNICFWNVNLRYLGQ